MKLTGEVLAKAHRRRAKHYGLNRKNGVDIRRGMNFGRLT